MFRTLLFFLCLFSSPAFALNLEAEVPSVVPVSWLKEHMGDRRLVVLDVGENQEYK